MLQCAIEKNDYKLVKETIETLLQEGTSLNLVDQKGYTALHIASKNGNLDIVTLLLEKGANVNISVSDNVETPLSLAINKEHVDIVQLLLERGADVNQRIPPGFTPLHCAVKVGNIKIIKILLDKGAGIDLKDIANGYAALHLAVIYYNEEKLRETFFTSIADNHFEIFCDYEEVLTEDPVECAVTSIQLYFNITKLLIERGADVNVTNWDEETPLHCAARQNQTALIKLLLEKGAESNLESSDGHTPIDLVTDDICLYDFIKHIALYNKTVNSCYKYQHHIWLECIKELDQMRHTYFENSSITWYSFLIEPDENKLEAYMCNEHVSKQLDNKEYKILFPKYESILKTQIYKGKKRQLLMQKIKNYFFSQLPVEDCWRKIFSYLNTNDLEQFIFNYKEPNKYL